MDIKKYKKEQSKSSKHEKISNALAKSIHLHSAKKNMEKDVKSRALASKKKEHDEHLDKQLSLAKAHWKRNAESLGFKK